MPMSGPTVVRRQLGRKLRALRVAAGKTDTEVAEAGIASAAKLWRIEKGQTAVKMADVRTLCWLYGASAEDTDALCNLSYGTQNQGWSEAYGNALPEWFRLYVDLEAAAASIWTVEEHVVPGELQTTDYAHAVYAAAAPDHPDEDIQRYVRLRLDRQQALFGRTPPPQLTVILGQNVLLRPVGGHDVLDAQIQHLSRLNAHRHIDIRILPFEAGAHAAMTGAFRILDFADPEDPEVVYLETQVGAHYLEKPKEVAEYRRVFDLTYKQAVPIEEFLQ